MDNNLKHPGQSKRNENYNSAVYKVTMRLAIQMFLFVKIDFPLQQLTVDTAPNWRQHFNDCYFARGYHRLMSTAIRAVIILW